MAIAGTAFNPVRLKVASARRMWVSEVTTMHDVMPRCRRIRALEIASSRVTLDADSSGIINAGTPSSSSARRMISDSGIMSRPSGGPPELTIQEPPSRW